MALTITSTPSEVRDAMVNTERIYVNERNAVDDEAKQQKKELFAEFRKRRRALSRLLPVVETNEPTKETP